MSKWYDQKKVDAMGFDESEWNKTVRLLDDPNISDVDKDVILDNYINSFLRKMGAKV